MTNQTHIKFMSKKSNNSLNHYKSGNNLFLTILAENNKVISPIKINNKSYENKNIFMW